MNFKTVAVASLSLFFAGQAVASVIVHDAQFGRSGETYLLLSQSIPSGEGLFRFKFSTEISSDESLELTFSTVVTYSSIAEHCRLFVVPVGVTFDADYVASHVPFVSNDNNPGSATLPYPTSNTVLAYWDDRALWSGTGPFGTPDASDFFGWVEISHTLDWDNFEILWNVVDGATALGGGIVVGTYTQVPEPGNCSLVFGTSALLFLARRKRTSAS